MDGKTSTLVVQSHRSPLPYSWIEPCLHSVQAWCESNSFDYQFLGDELFDPVPQALIQKFQTQKVILSDLARLKVLQLKLESTYDTVIWLDADFLIFRSTDFQLPDSPYALGREIWVQKDRQGNFKSYRKIHNAFMMFRKGNAFLDFYAETAERLLQQASEKLPPQFIGPKWLLAVHNISKLPVFESAGMLSPLVIKDLISGGGEALKLFIKQSALVPSAVNLCISSCDRNEVSQTEMQALIDILLKQGIEYKRAKGELQ